MKIRKLLLWILVSCYLCSIGSTAVASSQNDEVSKLNSEVVLLFQQGKYQQATEIAREALSIAEKSLSLDHPDLATSLVILGGLYLAQGQYAKADTLYQRSLAINEKAFGADHPAVATT